MHATTLRLIFLLVLACSASVQAREVKTLELGAAAPDFSLPGVDGKTYTLSDFSDSKVLMVVFTCNHCPTAQAYEDRLLQLQADYRDLGVQVVAISPNDPLAVRLDELGYTDVSDSLEDMIVRARDKAFTFPYLYDGETQSTSAAYGVIATPHVYIFDAARTLQYVGRIDDSEVKTVKSHDARNALDAMLAGQTISTPKTRVFGCSTKWADKRANARESIVKWNKEPVDLKLINKGPLQELVQNRSENYRLINVWATFCAPCIEELPEFVTMNRMYRRRKFELITVSADAPDQKADALKILTQQHVASQNYLFNSDSRDELFDSIDKKWEGALPYTVLIAPGGEIVYRKHGEIDPLQLKRIIADRVGRTYASR
jgi:peroxiredoxin